VTILSCRTDSADDIRIAGQADPSRLSDEARYRFHERLGILAGSATPTASQVAIAWREAAAYDRAATAASPLNRRTAP
jgi:hypothetical protein